MNTIEIYWSGIGVAYNGEHVRDGIRVISICATPVDDARSDIFAGYWISEETVSGPRVISMRGWPWQNSPCPKTSGSGNTRSTSTARPGDLRSGGIPRAASVGERVLSRTAGRGRTGYPWRLRVRSRRQHRSPTVPANRFWTLRELLSHARVSRVSPSRTSLTSLPVTRANFYYYFSDKTELFIELGTDTYRQALAVVEGFMEQGSPPNRETSRPGLPPTSSYLDRNGAFVIRSTEDVPPDRKFRAAVSRSHRRTAAALGQGIAKIASTPPDVDPVASGWWLWRCSSARG